MEVKLQLKNNKNDKVNFNIAMPIKESSVNRIMIVEDNDVHLEYLFRSIRGKYSEIQIDAARNEQQAIELLNNFVNNNQKNPYDFIIADISLEDYGGSKFGGIDLLEYVNQNSIDVNVIIITVHPGRMYEYPSGRKQGVFDRAKDLGAFACISRNQEGDYLDQLNEVININI